MTLPNRIDLVLVDFDDTLVATAPRFEAARNALFRLLAEQGFDEDLARVLHHEVVDPALRKQYGFGPRRMAHAFRETYTHLCRDHRRSPDPAIVQRCEDLGRSVEGTPPAIEGAIRALERLARHLPTVLYTQSSDEEYQLECVRGAGVLEVLPEGRIHICAHKTADALRQVLQRFGISEPGHACMIGNSMRSDINPALEVGAHAILVEVENPWAYDLAEPFSDAYLRVPSFAAAVDLLVSGA